MKGVSKVKSGIVVLERCFDQIDDDEILDSKTRTEDTTKQQYEGSSPIASEKSVTRTKLKH